MQNKLALAAFGRTTLSAALALAFGASLAACGGGSSSDDMPQAAAPARIVSVVAATGKAAAGSTVNVYDASKERVGFGGTDANGQANIAITASAKAPFLVTATTASGTVLSAVSMKERTINLTQLTSIITTQLLGATPAAATAASLAAGRVG